MNKLFSANPYDSLLKTFCLLISSITWLEKFSSNNVEALPFWMIISTVLLLESNKRLFLEEKYKPTKTIKILLLISFVFLILSLVVNIILFTVDYNQLLRAIDNSKEISLSKIFVKKHYYWPMIFYYLSFIPFVWDIICAVIIYIYPQKMNDYEYFDVTASNIN